MVVGVYRVELLLHAPGNLKEKRAIVQKVLGRCRVRFPVSAAETGLHDRWQRAELGFSMVAGDEAALQRTFAAIEAEIARTGMADVTEHFQEYLHY